MEHRGVGRAYTSRDKYGGKLTFESRALSALALAEEEDLDSLSPPAALLVVSEDAVDVFASSPGVLLGTEALLAVLRGLVWWRAEGVGDGVGV